MKIEIAQIKLKTGDFNFNYENIIKYIEKSDAGLIIFPRSDIEALGGKDLVYNEACLQKEVEMFEKIAGKNYPKTILIGDVLIKDEMAEEVEFFEFDGRKVYVSDSFIEDFDCDVYVFSHNIYFALITFYAFVHRHDS